MRIRLGNRQTRELDHGLKSHKKYKRFLRRNLYWESYTFRTLVKQTWSLSLNNYAPKGASNDFKHLCFYGLLKVGTPLLILISCRSAELSSPNMSIQGTKRIKTLSKQRLSCANCVMFPGSAAGDWQQNWRWGKDIFSSIGKRQRGNKF